MPLTCDKVVFRDVEDKTFSRSITIMYTYVNIIYTFDKHYFAKLFPLRLFHVCVCECIKNSHIPTNVFFIAFYLNFLRLSKNLKIHSRII